jgi:adenylate cyclase
MFQRWGIRVRLLLAFLCISLFAVLAAAAALYSFLEVGRTLGRIARKDMPQAIESMEVSRQSERMVNTAPAMLTAETLPQLDQIRTSMEATGDRIDEKILSLKASEASDKTLSTMEWNLGQLRSNVEELHDLIGHRSRIGESRKGLLSAFHDAYSTIVRLLAEATTALEARIANTRFAEVNVRPDTLIGLLESRAALLSASTQATSIFGTVLEAEMTERADQLSALQIRGRQAIGALDALQAGFEPSLRDGLQAPMGVLRRTIEGAGSIFARLGDESKATATARDILIENSWLSEELSGNVDQLVEAAKASITDAISKANATQRTSTWIILIIASLSLICSTLVVWLYVGRKIIARLTNLTTCMESVAGGDLKVGLPDAAGHDEIDRMTRALTVFRDTAVEIEERNLREIAQTRQRLLDAIESISEGFCYFDASDKLVVANNRFRQMIYPGDESAVVEGITFEQLIRQAAEHGHVKDAQNRVEAWVAERLARHRQPGPPHLQEHANGRWVMVSERRTGDGGTVAIYSDITDLKRREMDLAEKSASLEQLSNQIAKYLSPQIYDSIFTGKRQVKVDSRRRKLTIFFSDIAGFTETAEQLESEELTKLLNHYLTEMSKIALQHGATIDKYVGDAIVIFFGDPESRGAKEDALACVRMALEMRERMKALQVAWRDSGIAKPLQCRIGINTGFCTVGNFGSEDRMDYTIIGSGVNLASRLESAAAPGGILVSHETYALVKDEILCEPKGEIRLKGFSHPLETYEVVDSYEHLGRQRALIVEEFPHFKLNIDLQKLSQADRQRAASALTGALNRLG